MRNWREASTSVAELSASMKRAIICAMGIRGDMRGLFSLRLVIGAGYSLREGMLSVDSYSFGCLILSTDALFELRRYMEIRDC